MATKIGEYIDLLPYEKAQKQINLIDQYEEGLLGPEFEVLSEKTLQSIALALALKSLTQAARFN